MKTTKIQATPETTSQKRLPTPVLKNKTDTIAQKKFQDALPQASPAKRDRTVFEYPLSPALSPGASIAKRAFPGTPPSTPRQGTSRYVTALPPTPAKQGPKRLKVGHADSIDIPKDNSRKTAESFGKELPMALAGKSPIAFLQSKISMPLVGSMYASPIGPNIAVIQQPVPEKPTCGPGCVLMIGLTHMEKLIGSDKFWGWYSTTRLSNGESLLKGLRHLEIHAKVCKMTDASMPVQSDSENPDIERKFLDPKAAVPFVRETIQTTGNPVILAITHPIVKGHWIIVDGFQNECALIRDPYTGRAFAVPVETLSKWLLEKDRVQEMVYFPRA